jgi:hypothetical protein
MRLFKTELVKKLKQFTGVGVLVLVSHGAFADEVALHSCSNEPLPLTEKVQLIDAIECLFDASIIKLDPISATLQRTKPEYKGKKIYNVRFQQKKKIRNMLVDLLTGLPIDENVLEELNLNQ